MVTITIENVPEDIVKLYWIKFTYSNKIFNPEKKDIGDMTLLEYINSDEYKNETPKLYDNVEDFLSDLKKWT